MSDISKIRVDNIDYNVKDSFARNNLENKVPTGYYSGDMNELTTPGMYELNENSNLPSTCNYSQVIVCKGTPTATSCFQLAIDRNSATAIYRGGAKSGDTWNWQEWATLYSDKKSPVPVVTTADNGKVLKVVNGVWTAVAE